MLITFVCSKLSSFNCKTQHIRLGNVFFMLITTNIEVTLSSRIFVFFFPRPELQKLKLSYGVCHICLSNIRARSLTKCVPATIIKWIAEFFLPSFFIARILLQSLTTCLVRLVPSFRLGMSRFVFHKLICQGLSLLSSSGS